MKIEKSNRMESLFTLLAQRLRENIPTLGLLIFTGLLLHGCIFSESHTIEKNPNGNVTSRLNKQILSLSKRPGTEIHYHVSVKEEDKFKIQSISINVTSPQSYTDHERKLLQDIVVFEETDSPDSLEIVANLNQTVAFPGAERNQDHKINEAITFLAKKIDDGSESKIAVYFFIRIPEDVKLCSPNLSEGCLEKILVKYPNTASATKMIN